jgi:DNA-binding transcriptional regulator GbsR (MarR family)
MTPHYSSKETLREIESRLVEIITDMGTLKGRSKKMAEITAYITIRKEITQRLLRELTGYSLGSVSSVLQSLEKIGLVQKRKGPNSREYIYKFDESYTQPQSRSTANILEYFSQLEHFFGELDERLNQPGFNEKKGYEEVKEFVDDMKKLFPAFKNALSIFLQKQIRGNN